MSCNDQTTLYSFGPKPTKIQKLNQSSETPIKFVSKTKKSKDKNLVSRVQKSEKVQVTRGYKTYLLQKSERT